MFWQFFFLNIFMISCGAVLFMVARALPRIEDNATVKRSLFERWIASEFPERLDVFLRALSLRTLRRTKVLVMKADNTLNKKIERMKLERGEGIGGQKPDLSALKEIAETEEKTGAE